MTIKEMAEIKYPNRMGGLKQSDVDRYRAGYILGAKTFDIEPWLEDMIEKSGQSKSEYHEGVIDTLNLVLNKFKSLKNNGI